MHYCTFFFVCLFFIFWLRLFFFSCCFVLLLLYSHKQNVAFAQTKCWFDIAVYTCWERVGECRAVFAHQSVKGWTRGRNIIVAPLRWRATEMPVCFDMMQRSTELTAYKGNKSWTAAPLNFPLRRFKCSSEEQWTAWGERERESLWQKHKDVKMIQD